MFEQLKKEKEEQGLSATKNFITPDNLKVDREKADCRRDSHSPVQCNGQNLSLDDEKLRAAQLGKCLCGGPPPGKPNQ